MGTENDGVHSDEFLFRCITFYLFHLLWSLYFSPIFLLHTFIPLPSLKTKTKGDIKPFPQ